MLRACLVQFAIEPTVESTIPQNTNGTSTHDATRERFHWPREQRCNGNWVEGGYVRQCWSETAGRGRTGKIVNNNNPKGIN